MQQQPLVTDNSGSAEINDVQQVEPNSVATAAQPVNDNNNNVKIETQKPLTQEEISQKSIDKTRKFLKIYNDKFPEIIKLLNDVLRYGKDELTKRNERNEESKKQIDQMKIANNKASIAINDDLTEKTDVLFRLEILDRKDEEFSKEEQGRLVEIDKEVKAETEKTEKKDQAKIDILNKEKYSLTHKILASYLSDLIEITQQLNSLKEKVTTWTLNREVGEGEDKKIISQTFTHKKTYGEIFDKVALGAGKALLDTTQAVTNMFSKNTILADPHDLRMKDLIVAQNEKREDFIPFQACNNYLLDAHDANNAHSKISLETLIEVFHAGEMKIGS